MCNIYQYKHAICKKIMKLQATVIFWYEDTEDTRKYTEHAPACRNLK